MPEYIMVSSAIRALGERLVQRRAEGTERKSGRNPASANARRSSTRRRPGCESLEERALLTSPGYDYVLSGFSWPNPTHVTYSVAPDGDFWDHGTNNLNVTLNAQIGAGNWQRQIARALATWESVANINIVPVSDGPYDFNTLGLAQGDPRFGDIRFGGYVFPNNNTTTLAQTYYPPPNGSTAAGDVEVNTALGFKIGSTYDLYSVLLHETGHSLGLEHPPNPNVVMAPNYGGVREGLTAGDIAGIRAIYGARSLDAYQQQGLGTAPASAIDVSAGLSANSQETISNLGLPSIGSSEFFSIQAPANASGSLTVTASAANLSMLSPKVSVFDDSGALITQASSPASWSNTVSTTVPGVVPGRRYSIVVGGATGDFFDVGIYSLSLSLPSRLTSPPPVTTPPATPPPPSPNPPAPVPPAIGPDPFEPNNSISTASWLGRITQVTVSGLTFTPGADLDYFSFQAGRSASYRLTAAGAWLQVYNARGRMIARGYGQVSVPSQRAGTILYVRTSPPANSGASGYSLSVMASAPSSLKFWGRPVRQAGHISRR
jgi:hypothetical protein